MRRMGRSFVLFCLAAVLLAAVLLAGVASAYAGNRRRYSAGIPVRLAEKLEAVFAGKPSDAGTAGGVP